MIDPLIDLILLTEIPMYVVMSFILWYFGWHLPRQPYALVLRREQTGFLLVKKQVLNTKRECFEFEKHSYIVDWDKTAYLSSKGKPVLLYIEGTANPTRLNIAKIRNEEQHSSSKLNIVLAKETIRQLVEASKPTAVTINFLLVVLVAVASFMIGIFIAPYLPMHPTTTIVQNQTYVTPPVP